MNNYKSFSDLKEELGNNYDFKLYEMGISALKEIENLQQENKKLNGAIQTYDILLKANTEENKKLKKVIDRASARLEYFLIGNLKYQSSQEEFIKLVIILKEAGE